MKNKGIEQKHVSGDICGKHLRLWEASYLAVCCDGPFVVTVRRIRAEHSCKWIAPEKAC